MTADEITKIGNSVAGSLLGSTSTIRKELEELGHPELRHDPTLLAEIDSIAFECELCGWWCPIDEMSGDQTCDECEGVDDGED